MAFLSRPTVLKPPSRPMGATPHVGKKIGPWVKLLLGANFPFPQSRFCAQTVELSLSLSLRCARSCCLRSAQSLSLRCAFAHAQCEVKAGARFPWDLCPCEPYWLARHMWDVSCIGFLGSGKRARAKKVFHCSFTIRPLEREEGFFSDDHVREINNQVIPSPPRATFANIQVTFRTN